MMKSVRVPKPGALSVAGAIFMFAAIQPLAANPVYHLGPGAEYSLGSGIGTFVIPSVAQGLLFYLDADNPPTEVTLTGLYSNFGEKLQCIAVTRSTFACSVEGALHAANGNEQDGWQANGGSSKGNGPLGHGSNNSNGSTGDNPITDLGNGSGGDLSSLVLFQTAPRGTDLAAGPTSVPGPGSLILLVSALLSLAITTSGLRRRYV